MDIKCNHNARCRYTHGFFCEDCQTFFPKESPTYRRSELLSSIWMVLHNINVDNLRAGHGNIEEIINMRDMIGIGIDHENYEELISMSESIMDKYEKDSSSSHIPLSLHNLE